MQSFSDSDRRVVPVLFHQEEPFPAFPFSSDDAIRVGQIKTHRLLAQHIPAGPEGSDGHVGMKAGRGTDVDDIGVDIEKRIEILDGHATIFCRRSFCPFLLRIANRYKSGTRVFTDMLRMA